MSQLLALVYGGGAYVVFLGTFLYAIAFVPIPGRSTPAAVDVHAARQGRAQ